MTPRATVLVLVLCLGLIGCDSEKLLGVDTYHVTIFSADGDVVSKGTFYIEYQPPSRPYCEAMGCPNEEIIGEWVWRKPLVENRSRGSLFGTINHYNKVSFGLRGCPGLRSCGFGFTGSFTYTRYADMEGDIIVYEDGASVRNGHTFQAKYQF